MKLKLAETFTSIQGEGHLTGKRMFFIRFGGCSVSQCPLHPAQSGFCDENWRSRSTIADEIGFNLLCDEAIDEVGVGGWVCITGGEPTDQQEALSYLAADIRRRGMKLNIQSSGIRPVLAQWDWLTISPKVPVDDLKQLYGNELKLVYMDQDEDELRDYYLRTKFWNYQLQPLWEKQKCLNMGETLRAIHATHAGPYRMRWELSMQSHKFMNVR